ncbi:MAG: PEGA domain-containing protein [Deltaproteobacteria bacterium]|nr:PEGA domain-containing protein [Deltaproteobacteria bacterium]
MTKNRSLGVVLVALGAAFGCSSNKPALQQKASSASVKIVLRSFPSGAAVFNEGRDRLGKTPLTLHRNSGQRILVHFVKEGYKTARRRHFVEGRPDQNLTVHLEKQTGTIIVKTPMVHGAMLFVDGKRHGRAPLRVEVPLGRHEIEVRHKGVDPFKKTVVVSTPKEKVVVEAVLARQVGKKSALGWLTVIADRPAEVFAGGLPLGKTPLRHHLLAPRAYKLRVTAIKGSAVRKVEVTVKPRHHETVRVSFAKKR